MAHCNFPIHIIDLPPPPPAFPSQFGAMSEDTNSMDDEHPGPHLYVQPHDRISLSTASMEHTEPMPSQHRHAPTLDPERVVHVEEFKEEVKLRLAWLDDEIRLLELRERWWNTRFSDRSRRKRERRKLDDLERELRLKWEQIFFVTRYREMSERYGKMGLMHEYEGFEDNAEHLTEHPSIARRPPTPWTQ